MTGQNTALPIGRHAPLGDSAVPSRHAQPYKHGDPASRNLVATIQAWMALAQQGSTSQRGGCAPECARSP
eukprot:7791193-Alexandrium_andersonii.AAC.1